MSNPALILRPLSAERRGQNTSVVATAVHCSGRATYSPIRLRLRRMAVVGLRQRTGEGGNFTRAKGRCTHSQTRRFLRAAASTGPRSAITGAFERGSFLSKRPA
jgi:hypothetical protein